MTAVNISDHLPVFVNRKKINVISEKAKFSGRSYRQYDTDVFANEFMNQNWDVFDQTTDPNLLWEIFCEKIVTILDRQCPMKTFSIKQYKEPWITNELLELIKDKDLALRKAKKSKKDSDWKIACRFRNDCLSKIRKAKSDFVKNQLNNNQNDSKKFWKNVKDIWPSKKSKNSKITLIDQDTKKEIPVNETADYINRFFTHIGPKLSQELNDPWLYEGVVADRHLLNIEVNTIELYKLCKEIDIHKSSSVENISSRILKDAFMVQIDRLQYLVSQIFKTGIYPSLWKIANIIKITQLYHI